MIIVIIISSSDWGPRVLSMASLSTGRGTTQVPQTCHLIGSAKGSSGRYRYRGVWRARGNSFVILVVVLSCGCPGACDDSTPPHGIFSIPVLMGKETTLAACCLDKKA